MPWLLEDVEGAGGEAHLAGDCYLFAGEDVGECGALGHDFAIDCAIDDVFAIGAVHHHYHSFAFVAALIDIHAVFGHEVLE